MDVSTIEPGQDFRKVIHSSISTCSVLLAIIGHQWTELKNPAGVRRLDDPNDIVRTEIAYALRRDITVVPVLVQGAQMPTVEQLPEDLIELAYRNAVDLTHPRWKSDVHLLIQALAPFLEGRETESGVLKRGREEGEAVSNDLAHSFAKDMSNAKFVSKIETRTIERVGRELATYIGPISEIVVKRVAKHCSRVEELYERAAQEIEMEADRARFLRACTR